MSKFSEELESYKKQKRLENLQLIRKEINSKATKEKIENFRKSYDYIWSEKEIVDAIMTNDIVAAKFSKDPGKQNVGEELIEKILGWKKLSPSGKNCIRFNKQGDIVHLVKDACCKSTDYLVSDRYITQKYTGEEGGAQDNQKNDVIAFLEVASIKHKCGACLDGKYWDEMGHKKKLIEKFKDNPNILIFGVDDIREGKISLV